MAQRKHRWFHMQSFCLTMNWVGPKQGNMGNAWKYREILGYIFHFLGNQHGGLGNSRVVQGKGRVLLAEVDFEPGEVAFFNHHH